MNHEPMPLTLAVYVAKDIEYFGRDIDILIPAPIHHSLKGPYGKVVFIGLISDRVAYVSAMHTFHYVEDDLLRGETAYGHALVRYSLEPTVCSRVDDCLVVDAHQVREGVRVLYLVLRVTGWEVQLVQPCLVLHKVSNDLG